MAPTRRTAALAGMTLLLAVCAAAVTGLNPTVITATTATSVTPTSTTVRCVGTITWDCRADHDMVCDKSVKKCTRMS